MIIKFESVPDVVGLRTAFKGIIYNILVFYVINIDRTFSYFYCSFFSVSAAIRSFRSLNSSVSAALSLGERSGFIYTPDRLESLNLFPNIDIASQDLDSLTKIG